MHAHYATSSVFDPEETAQSFNRTFFQNAIL
jgi:hypothetical protein